MTGTQLGSMAGALALGWGEGAVGRAVWKDGGEVGWGGPGDVSARGGIPHVFSSFPCRRCNPWLRAGGVEVWWLFGRCCGGLSRVGLGRYLEVDLKSTVMALPWRRMLLNLMSPAGAARTLYYNSEFYPSLFIYIYITRSYAHPPYRFIGMQRGLSSQRRCQKGALLKSFQGTLGLRFNFVSHTRTVYPLSQVPSLSSLHVFDFDCHLYPPLAFRNVYPFFITFFSGMWVKQTFGLRFPRIMNRFLYFSFHFFITLLRNRVIPDGVHRWGLELKLKTPVEGSKLKLIELVLLLNFLFLLGVYENTLNALCVVLVQAEEVYWGTIKSLSAAARKVYGCTINSPPAFNLSPLQYNLQFLGGRLCSKKFIPGNFQKRSAHLSLHKLMMMNEVGTQFEDPDLDPQEPQTDPDLHSEMVSVSSTLAELTKRMSKLEIASKKKDEVLTSGFFQSKNLVEKRIQRFVSPQFPVAPVFPPAENSSEGFSSAIPPMAETGLDTGPPLPRQGSHPVF